jgi:hypothetical protein
MHCVSFDVISSASFVPFLAFLIILTSRLRFLLIFSFGFKTIIFRESLKLNGCGWVLLLVGCVYYSKWDQLSARIRQAAAPN